MEAVRDSSQKQPSGDSSTAGPTASGPSSEASLGTKLESSASSAKYRPDRLLYVPIQRRMAHTEGEASSSETTRNNDDWVHTDSSNSSKARPDRQLYVPVQRRVLYRGADTPSTENSSEKEQPRRRHDYGAVGSLYVPLKQHSWSNAPVASSANTEDSSEQAAEQRFAKLKRRKAKTKGNPLNPQVSDCVFLCINSLASTDESMNDGARDTGNPQLDHLSSTNNSNEPSDRSKKDLTKGMQPVYPCSHEDSPKDQPAKEPCPTVDPSTSTTHRLSEGQGNNARAEQDPPIKAKKKCRRKYKKHQDRDWKKAKQEMEAEAARKANTNQLEVSDIKFDEEGSTWAPLTVSANRQAKLYSNTDTPQFIHYPQHTIHPDPKSGVPDDSIMPIDSFGRGRGGLRGKPMI